ncbi:MAG: T9SS type A sorting domain-containing protein [Salinivirgaceae bacterium]|nr:T9SS type A sorting domain-containing protein [Salinivirgaceae bacterium]
MKKRVFILLLAVLFNAVGVYAETIISKTTIQSGTQTINESVTVNRGVTYTINGDLTVIGDFIANGATIIVNGTLHVTGNYNNSYDTYWFTTYYSDTQVDGTLIVDNTITNNGNITVNGNVEAGYVEVNKTMTVNSDAILYIMYDLTINADGAITMTEGSKTIVGRDFNQDGYAGFVAHTGDVNAEGATLIVGRDYNIYQFKFLGLEYIDETAEYLDPGDNYCVVLRNNNMDIIPGIDASVLEARKADFIANNGNDLSAYYSVVMPIELVYFEAYHSADQVYFKWQTASELNNDYFTIECSTDAEDFEPLATVQGSGTTNYTVDYDYQYRLNYVGTMYYRLKQTDYDGSSTYSKTEAVTFAAKVVTKTNDFTIYPNPAVDFVTIAGGEYESVAFVSSDGKIVSEQAPQSRHSVEMLPKGLNIVVIRTANGNVSKTIIKQ